MALEAKNKTCFVDGSLQELVVGDPLWHRDNKIVLSWVVRSLSTKIA